jgi:hypothetical protein
MQPLTTSVTASMLPANPNDNDVRPAIRAPMLGAQASAVAVLEQTDVAELA